MISTLPRHRRIRVLTLGISTAAALYAVMAVFAEPLWFSGTGSAQAATSTGSIVVSLVVASDISNSCTSPVSLGTITRTGDTSVNTCAATGYCATTSTACTVTTNATTGYSLQWVIRTGTGATGSRTGTGYLNGYTLANRIKPLGTGSTVAAGQPQAFNTTVAANDARWAARLSSTSTTTGGGGKNWGSDGTSDTWLRISTGSTVTIASRASQTSVAGDTQNIGFRAIIHGTAVVPSDVYKATVVITAVEN